MRIILIYLFIVFNISAAYATTQSEPATSKPLHELVDHAIKKFEKTNKQDWTFHVARYENEEGDITSSIERFAPQLNLEQPWQLISLNGQTPNKKQKTAFQKEKNEKQSDHSLRMPLRELIQLETLQLLAETATTKTLQFDVFVKRFGKKASKKLQGQLIYNRKHDFIEQITITNNSDFSPVFSANISDLELVFKFIKIDQFVLPARHEMRFKGTFAYFTEIDETAHDTYSDYQFIGNSNKPIEK